MQLEGIINLDKPAGLTSARAVSRVKRMLPSKTKVGHAGTLDPFATGVLLVLIGKATKACEKLMSAAKMYEAVIHLGATTATDDVDADEIPWPGAEPVGNDLVKETLAQFVGDILQQPPAYSALKVGGRRAYVLARLGRAPKLAARTVRIDSIELLSYYWPLVGIRVRCGRGTYIRALARDIGEKLNVGGYLTALRRTSVGTFDISSSVSLETLAIKGVAAHIQPVPSFLEVSPPS
jgi:tRNA pseudouridine55 synthase